MQNRHLWKPTKFILRAGRCVSSKDEKHVGKGSRLITNIVALVYEQAIRQHARGVLLDLGCGEVPFYEVYRPYVTDNVCVDWINTKHENPCVDHQYDLNRSIPLQNSHFDTILATDVLEHILEPDLLWSEMSRLLKPGGKLILGVPFLYWIHEEPYDYYRYTKHRLTSYCTTHQLDVLTLQAYGGPSEVMRDILAKLADSATRPIRVGFQITSLMLKIAFYIQGSQNKKEMEKFPLGYCLVAQKKQPGR